MTLTNDETRTTTGNLVQECSVSVIMPAFNSAGVIGAAIDSALGQRGVATEIIVVDDGSTDGTGRILEQYGNSIRVIRQANQGAYVARNAAAEIATGEWLAFLDADDLWAVDKLARQLDLATPEVGMVYSDCANLDESGRVSGRVSDAHELVEGRIFDSLLTINFISTSTVLMRRKDFTELGGFTTEIRGCADWDLWLRYAIEGREVRVCRDALAQYRWHEGQMSKNFLARQRDRLTVIRRAIDLARSRGVAVSRVQESKAYGSSWATAAWFVAPTDRWQAARWCVRALLWQPFEPSNYKLLVKAILGLV
jgi:glycosyltransferase involved in cell wall biosynthesis